MPLFNKKNKSTNTEVVEDKKPVKKTARKPAAKKPEAVKSKSVKLVGLSPLAIRVDLKPMVTEKTAHLADGGIYAFKVDAAANRTEVRDAFRELYKVTPVSVNIIRVHGKEKRFGRFSSRRSDWKKALVTVPAGTRLDIFSL